MTAVTDEKKTEPEADIVFQGRTIWVHMPRPEQLVVWKRALVRLQEMTDAEAAKGFTGDQVMAALERSRKIIDTLLVNEEDKEWLDDEMLDGRLTLQGASDIILLATDRFAELAKAEGNRDTRRAATKAPAAKKAIRKAAR